MNVVYSKKFLKELDKSPKKIKKAFFKRLRLFKDDYTHPLLRNHNLTGKMTGLSSVNITGDWRAVYEKQSDEAVVFVRIGTHSQLYK